MKNAKNAYMGLGAKAKIILRQTWKDKMEVKIPSTAVNNKPFVDILSALQKAGALKLEGVNFPTCSIANGTVSIPKKFKSMFLHNTKDSEGNTRWSATDTKE